MEETSDNEVGLMSLKGERKTRVGLEEPQDEVQL